MQQFKIGVKLLLFFTLLLGVIYPIVITLIAQTFFSDKANGSLIVLDNKLIGSSLIGQYFSDPRYFWGRPSATQPFPYNAENSMGSNLGPSNQQLFSQIKIRIENNKKFSRNELIPVDLVTASASGLDPDISPQSAYYQIPRIAKIRNIPEEKIRILIQKYIQKSTFGILGESRVNVLALNIALDQLGNDNEKRTQ